MSTQTKIWKTIGTALLCLALLFVAGGIGYGHFDGVFWVALGYLILSFLFHVFVGFSSRRSNGG